MPFLLSITRKFYKKILFTYKLEIVISANFYKLNKVKPKLGTFLVSGWLFTVESGK